MAKLTMVQALNLALHQEMHNDDSVIVMGEDVGVDGGVFRVTEGLSQQFGEARVLDTPLAEAAIIGTAIGMALAGLKPVAEIQFCGFSYLTIAQLEAHASRFRSRTHGLYQVPLVMRFPYGAGVRALEHHSETPDVTYARISGLKVVVPSGPRNARALLVSAIRDPDPVIFMEPKRSYRAFREEVPDQEETLPLGKAQVIEEGKDITVIAWGAMMRPALQAVAEAKDKRGVSVEVIDLLTISPMDGTTIVESIKKTGRAVIVQEGPRSLGVAAEIIARVNDKALLSLEAPIKRVTGYDVVTPYFSREEWYIPSSERIVRAIDETLAF